MGIKQVMNTIAVVDYFVLLGGALGAVLVLFFGLRAVKLI